METSSRERTWPHGAIVDTNDRWEKLAQFHSCIVGRRVGEDRCRDYWVWARAARVDAANSPVALSLHQLRYDHAILYRLLMERVTYHPKLSIMAKKTHAALVPVEDIARSILVLRGHRVILDRDLAAIYGVSTGRLNEAVKRNARRFPADFMFQLTTEESEHLRSHFAISSWGGRRYLPYAFAEHGAIQAANVINSNRAVEMGIYVVRAFVKLRELLASNKELARRLDELEARIEKKLTTHDQAIAAMLSAIRQLMRTPVSKTRPIGFTANLQR